MSDSNPRQFLIHGVITDWDSHTRQLFIAGVVCWVERQVLVSDTAVGAWATIVGHRQGPDDRRIVTQLTLQSAPAQSPPQRGAVPGRSAAGRARRASLIMERTKPKR
jgi:hypothetical protein